MNKKSNKSASTMAASFAKSMKMTGIQPLINNYKWGRVGNPTRTTLSLQQKSIDMLVKLEEIFGLSPRQVFSASCEIPHYEEFDSFKNLDEGSRKDEKIKKTYVVDDYALNKLKKIANELNISRDYCVESFIKTIYTSLISAHEDMAKEVSISRKKLTKVITYFNELDSYCTTTFGDAHHLIDALDEVYDKLEKISDSMANFIEKGVWKDMS